MAILNTRRNNKPLLEFVGYWPQQNDSDDAPKPKNVTLKRGDDEIVKTDLLDCEKFLKSKFVHIRAGPKAVNCNKPRTNFFAIFVSHANGDLILQDRSILKRVLIQISDAMCTWLERSAFSFVLYRDDNDTGKPFSTPLAYVAAGKNQTHFHETVNSILNHRDVPSNSEGMLKVFDFTADEGLVQIDMRRKIVDERQYGIGVVAMFAAGFAGLVSIAAGLALPQTGSINYVLLAGATGLFLFSLYSCGSAMESRINRSSNG